MELDADTFSLWDSGMTQVETPSFTFDPYQPSYDSPQTSYGFDTGNALWDMGGGPLNTGNALYDMGGGLNTGNSLYDLGLFSNSDYGSFGQFYGDMSGTGPFNSLYDAFYGANLGQAAGYPAGSSQAPSNVLQKPKQPTPSPGGGGGGGRGGGGSFQSPSLQPIAVPEWTDVYNKWSGHLDQYINAGTQAASGLNAARFNEMAGTTPNLKGNLDRLGQIATDQLAGRAPLTDQTVADIASRSGALGTGLMGTGQGSMNNFRVARNYGQLAMQMQQAGQGTLNQQLAISSQLNPYTAGQFTITPWDQMSRDLSQATSNSQIANQMAIARANAANQSAAANMAGKSGNSGPTSSGASRGYASSPAGFDPNFGRGIFGELAPSDSVGAGTGFGVMSLSNSGGLSNPATGNGWEQMTDGGWWKGSDNGVYEGYNKNGGYYNNGGFYGSDPSYIDYSSVPGFGSELDYNF